MFAEFNELTSTELTSTELVLYTDSLITRGSIRTRQHRVTDILNLAEESFLILEDVTVDEYGGRGQPIRAPFAQVNLDTVLFAVSNTPVEPIAELRSPKTRELAIVSVPPFRVTGTIHLMPIEGSLRASLSELSGRFLPVTEATFWSDQVGEARQTALVLAVNHRRAHILAPFAEVDPWAGLGAPSANEAAEPGS